jgi:hypothetical protein
MTYQPELFTIDDVSNWQNHLLIEGYVVIKDIISQKNANTAINMFKDEISYVSPNFDWNDKSTWITNNSPLIWSKSSVMYNGFGHSNSNWYLRLNSHVKDAFSKIYGTNELATSFDGFSLFISDKQKSTPWLHQDQRPTDMRYSAQGILNLLPCGIDDAGFICVPRSHIDYTPPDQNYNRDWILLPDEHPYQKEAIKLLTPERSLILFNSKLVHANTGICKKHPRGIHMNRLSSYITFVPKARQTPEIIQQRVQGYLNGIACSHWADRFEEKTLPFRIKDRYLARNFNDLVPLTHNGHIPKERLELI